MGIFDNLFGSSQDYEQRIEQKRFAQAEREQAIKDAQQQEQRERPAFEVGNTPDGRVTLSIGGYHNTWINMTNEGVDQLVTVLLAAKDRHSENTTVVKKDEDEEE